MNFIFKIIFVFFAFHSLSLRAQSISEIKIKKNQTLVVMPDVHGDWERASEVLKVQNILSDKGEWIGGNSIVLFLGDLVDRGFDSLEVIDRIIDLQKEAEKFGGKVESLKADHEQLWGTGYHLYLSEEDRNQIKNRLNEEMNRSVEFSKKVNELKGSSEFLNLVKSQEKLFPELYLFLNGEGMHKSKNGSDPVSIRKWLSDRPTLLKVGKRIYVHADLSVAVLNLGIDEVNKSFDQYFQHLFGIKKLNDDDFQRVQELANGEDSPIWSRKTSESDKVFNLLNFSNEEETLKSGEILKKKFEDFQIAFKKIGVVGFVNGHTIQPSIQSISWSNIMQRAQIRLDGKLSRGFEKVANKSVGNAVVMKVVNDRVEIYVSPFHIDGNSLTGMALVDAFYESKIAHFSLDPFLYRKNGLDSEPLTWAGTRVYKDAGDIESAYLLLWHEQNSAIEKPKTFFIPTTEDTNIYPSNQNITLGALDISSDFNQKNKLLESRIKRKNKKLEENFINKVSLENPLELHPYMAVYNLKNELVVKTIDPKQLQLNRCKDNFKEQY